MFQSGFRTQLSLLKEIKKVCPLFWRVMSQSENDDVSYPFLHHEVSRTLWSKGWLLWQGFSGSLLPLKLIYLFLLRLQIGGFLL